MIDMKKLLFVTLIAAFSTAASAQGNINQGNIMIGGNLGFNSSKYGNSNSKSSSLFVSPNVGYFFINNLAGGLRVHFSNSKEESGSFEYSETAFRLTPFVRYYFLPSSQKVNVFADAGYGFGSTKYKETGDPDVTQNVSGYTVSAGAAIFIVPSVALEIGLGYNSDKFNNATERYNTIQALAGLQIHLGGSGASK